MKVKGIKRGQAIELLEELSIPDGSEITIEIQEAQYSNQDDRWQKFNGIIGAWKDNPEITAIFAEIDQARHTELGTVVDFDSMD